MKLEMCKPFLGGFKQQLDPRCYKKKPLAMLVLMNKWF
jgi:hypothetical protein